VVRNTDYKAPQYIVFSIPLLTRPSQAQTYKLMILRKNVGTNSILQQLNKYLKQQNIIFHFNFIFDLWDKYFTEECYVLHISIIHTDTLSLEHLLQRAENTKDTYCCISYNTFYWIMQYDGCTHLRTSSQLKMPRLAHKYSTIVKVHPGV
jgi:hypothetical protein